MTGAVSWESCRVCPSGRCGAPVGVLWAPKSAGNSADWEPAEFLGFLGGRGGATGGVGAPMGVQWWDTVAAKGKLPLESEPKWAPPCFLCRFVAESLRFSS